MTEKKLKRIVADIRIECEMVSTITHWKVTLTEQDVNIFSLKPYEILVRVMCR